MLVRSLVRPLCVCSTLLLDGWLDGWMASIHIHSLSAPCGHIHQCGVMMAAATELCVGWSAAAVFSKTPGKVRIVMAMTSEWMYPCIHPSIHPSIHRARFGPPGLSLVWMACSAFCFFRLRCLFSAHSPHRGKRWPLVVQEAHSIYVHPSIHPSIYFCFCLLWLVAIGGFKLFSFSPSSLGSRRVVARSETQ